MTPDELRKAIDKLLPLDEFDYEKAEAWNAGHAAADAWEKDRFDLGVYKATFAEMSKQLEAAEKAYNAVVLEVKAHGGTLMPFDQAIAALAGEEKP